MEGNSKGDFRGDFTQEMEGDLLPSSGQVWSRQSFSMGLCRSSVIVVRPVGELSELSLVLAVTPDLVHHGFV